MPAAGPAIPSHGARGTPARETMLTVKRIGLSKGYSRDDHLLDDTALQAMVGRSFRSVAEARKACRAIEKRHPQATIGCRMAPVWAIADVCGDSVEVEL